MRASRLLSILTILQARGRVTAPELATECEVSLRIIALVLNRCAHASISTHRRGSPKPSSRRICHSSPMRSGHNVLFVISRVLDLEILDQRFERPVEFNLASYWQTSTQRLEAELHQNSAIVRFSPWAVKMLEAFTSPYVRAATQIEPEADVEGWYRAQLPVGSIRQACVDLLRLGAEAEVLAPPELRSKMAEVAVGMGMIYGK